jgi:D-sedoheptulose 7-phosphate isomerase
MVLTTESEKITNVFKKKVVLLNKILETGTLFADIEDAINIIKNALKENKKILIAGNGGSSSDSQHMAGEFMCKLNIDRSPIPAIALSADNTIITAISNDFDYEFIFSRQIKALCNEGDVVLLYSTSGKSRNILNAIKQSVESKARVIGFTGERGFKESRMLNKEIKIPTQSTQLIQEIHYMINHIICERIELALINV